MIDDRAPETAVFPRAGVAARRWSRFERDYRAWLRSPDGRFATWRAVRTVDLAAVTADRPRRCGDG